MASNQKNIVRDFLSKNIDEVRELKKQGKTHLEVAQYFYSDDLPISATQVGDFCRKNKIYSMGMRAFTGDKNPASRPEVRNKISNTVSKLWSDGIYDYRINGMLGLTGELHPSYGKDFPKGIDSPNFKGALERFRDKYLYYIDQEIPVCERCGKPLIDCKWDVHHIDENHKNNSLTNLMGLCVPCHQKYHIKWFKHPFVRVSRTFLLEVAHYLPEYDGKCFFTHGHRYEVNITVKRRMDPETGMVLDFHGFRDVVKEHLDNIYDHSFLNDFLVNPTSERFILLIWRTLSPYLKGMCEISLNESRDTKISLSSDEYSELVRLGEIENEWLVPVKTGFEDLHNTIKINLCNDIGSDSTTAIYRESDNNQ